MLVFGRIAVAPVLFVIDAIPTDVTVIGVIVAIAVLEPLTDVSGTQAISGFASPRTVTIVAMYMLSAGIRKTGVVQLLGRYIECLARGNETRLPGEC